MRETTKAQKRRQPDPLWQTVFKGVGIDIGAGDDPLRREWYPGITTLRTFDKPDGNAQNMRNYYPDNYFDFVYSSNCLEHLADPHAALKSWIAIAKPGGYVVFLVPDEDLYEQGVWPSRWNHDHKWSFTMYKAESWCPCSINIADLLRLTPGCCAVRCDVIDAGYDRALKDVDQTKGEAEAFIEVVLRKEQ
jgi:SAM-dependent methyltransferase